MAAVGSLVVSLSTNSAKFTEGLAKGSRSLKDFQRSGKEAGEGFNIASLVEGGLIIEGITKGLEFVGEGFKSAAEHITEWVATSVEAAHAAYLLSGALGIPVQELEGLQFAAKIAGVDTETFTTSIQKLNKSLGEAATSGGKPADAINLLGLSVKKLTSQSLDKTFKDIADKVSQIKNPMEQATIVCDLFGKSGQKLTPLFNEGATGIQAAIDKAKELGVSMSDIDNAKLEDVHSKFEELNASFEGFKNQLTIAVAKVLIEIGTEILSIIPKADTMRDAFETTIMVVVGAVGALADAFEEVKIACISIADAAISSFASISDCAEKVAEDLVYIYNKLTNSDEKVPDFIRDSNEALQAFAQGFSAQLATEVAKPLPSTSIDAWYAGVIDKADKAAASLVKNKNKIVEPIESALDEAGKHVHSILDEMEQELAEFGKNSGQKKIDDLIRSGASPEQIAHAKDLNNQLDQLEKHQENLKEGKKIFEANQTPLDKYRDTLTHLNELLNDNAISQETYAQAVQKAMKDEIAAEDKKDDTIKKTAAVERRRDFKLPDQNKITTNDSMSRLVKIQQDAQSIAAQQLKALQDTNHYLAGEQSDTVEIAA
jgi:hypothetical protein